MGKVPIVEIRRKGSQRAIQRPFGECSQLSLDSVTKSEIERVFGSSKKSVPEMTALQEA